MPGRKMQLPTLFKGAGPGTHWHINDPKTHGFTSAAHRPHTKNAVISHITAYSFPSPYVSFTTSFAVARQYALSGPKGVASRRSPGYVYEIDLSACTVAPIIFNPIEEISKANLAHAHNGDQSLILGVASQAHSRILRVTVPHSGGLMALPNISSYMKALVNALRDAEILVNTVPGTCVVMRHNVF
jgi:hypothetical protein